MLFSSPFLAAYCLGLAALLGLVLGSSFNCLAWRLAHGEAWAGSGRSKCPSCGHTLGPADLVPLFSWLALGGKCRYCHKPISIRYPLSEAALALIFVSLLLRYDLTLDALQYAILCACLFCLSLVDWEIYEIPNRFLVIAALNRFFFLAVQGAGTAGCLSALLHGLALGGSVLALSLVMDHLLKKESMGGGDIKLLLVLGLYFNLPCILLLMVLSCLFGLALALFILVKRPEAAFPFGPALSLGAFCTLLFGAPLTGWYLSLF